jgi:hypothetical protein
LRKIEEQIDVDFIYDEVEDCYGDNGNVSVAPPVILKMMLLLILYRDIWGQGLTLDISFEF